MAETLELQQVICPSCKQVITSFSPFAAEVECPYCHNKAFNPLITAKKVPIPERIIIFKTKEGDFEQSMVNSLVERDYVPKDIFSCINTGNIIKAYLPMFLYEGKYQSSWSCNVAYETTELGTNMDGTKLKQKKVKKYAPQTGTSQGNFAFLCLAYEGNDIPEELRTFCYQFPYQVMASKEYDPDLLGLSSGESPLTMAMDTDTDLVWNKYGDGLVMKLASDNASQQLHCVEYKDFHASNSYDLKHNGRYVLAPFWFVYYTYGNNKYYYIMDGLGENNAMSAPADQEEVKYVEGKETIKKIVKWLWLIAIPLLFVKFAVAVIYLVVWIVARIIINIIMNRMIESRLEASRAARREAAEKL